MTERMWFNNPRDKVVKPHLLLTTLETKNNKTRGHEVTLVKDQCRLDIRKYSFSKRTINE